MAQRDYLTNLSNPAIVAACLLEDAGVETDPECVAELAAHCDVLVSVSRCSCGWWDYVVDVETCSSCRRKLLAVSDAHA